MNRLKDELVAIFSMLSPDSIYDDYGMLWKQIKIIAAELVIRDNIYCESTPGFSYKFINKVNSGNFVIYIKQVAPNSHDITVFFISNETGYENKLHTIRLQYIKMMDLESRIKIIKLVEIFLGHEPDNYEPSNIYHTQKISQPTPHVQQALTPPVVRNEDAPRWNILGKFIFFLRNGWN